MTLRTDCSNRAGVLSHTETADIARRRLTAELADTAGRDSGR